MNKQRKVVITTTYNEMGIIIDTKAEELDSSAQPDLQPTCNQLATDLISRQSAINALCKSGCDSTYCGVSCPDVMAIENLPSAQPEIIRCKDCKHYEADIMANPWGVCCHDGWVDGNSGHEVSENGWCYRAERRTDETQNH